MTTRRAPSDSRCCISRWCACAVIRRVSLRACVRACNGHRWARRTGGGDPAVGGSGVEGADARSVKPYRHRRRPFLPRVPHPDTPTTPSHSTTAPPGRGTPPPTSSTCPIHLPKGPFSWCPRVRVRACARMHVAHAAAP